MVEVAVRPCELKSWSLENPGVLLEMGGIAHVSHLPLHIAERMRASALAPLSGLYAPEHCSAVAMQEESAIGSGGAIVLWARHEHSVLGAGCVAERGIRAERLGGDSGAALRAELMARTALDVHAADQILVYLALAATNGPSYFTVREMTSHARTAMWLIEQLLPARFTIEPHAGYFRVRVAGA
jgi:RNA 3'-terminal phosphate cyclase